MVTVVESEEQFDAAIAGVSTYNSRFFCKEFMTRIIRAV